jgi:hypothetical protein
LSATEIGSGTMPENSDGGTKPMARLVARLIAA